MSEPGYYKVNYAALRLHELSGAFRWYLSVPFWLASRLTGKRLSRGGTWMPLLSGDGECKPADLSDDFWQATKQHRADFERLGFTKCRLVKPPKSLEPIVRDQAVITFLDSTRSYFGRLTYLRIYHAIRRKELNRIRLSFIAVFENGTLSCVNRSATFDACDSGKVISVNSADVPKIYERFREELQRSPETPLSFPDDESLRKWFDARAIKSLHDCVRRGLFIRLTDSEVADARANLERKKPQFLVRPIFDWRKQLAAWVLLLLGILGLVFLHRNPLLINMLALKIQQHYVQNQESEEENSTPMTTVDYQGQKFKLSKSYTDLDVYKNDPNNLDTNELPRIERTMESAKLPATFKDYKEYISVTSELEFPGYGEAAGMDRADDGSMLLFDMFEIPQADKERVVVGRGQTNTAWTLVDDFIYAGSDTDDIKSVRLEHGQLEYFDQKGKLVRKKAI